MMAVSMMYWLGSALAVGLLAYLIFALFFAEEF